MQRWRRGLRRRPRALERLRPRVRCCSWWAASAGARGCWPMCWRSSSEVRPAGDAGPRGGGEKGEGRSLASEPGGRAGGGGPRGPGARSPSPMGAYGGSGTRASVGLLRPDCVLTGEGTRVRVWEPRETKKTTAPLPARPACRGEGGVASNLPVLSSPGILAWVCWPKEKGQPGPSFRCSC